LSTLRSFLASLDEVGRGRVERVILWAEHVVSDQIVERDVRAQIRGENARFKSEHTDAMARAKRAEEHAQLNKAEKEGLKRENWELRKRFGELEAVIHALKLEIRDMRQLRVVTSPSPPNGVATKPEEEK
jgi:hypothetical protein